MKKEIQLDRCGQAYLLFVTLFSVFLSFTWQGNKGFSLWDEGYLWYGIRRVLVGEVPILHFMAYDPGRYYWSAALLSAVGDQGIMGVRASVALFQGLGLLTGLLLIAKSTPNRGRGQLFFLLTSAVILMAWMLPRHKLFDISLSIFLIGILTFLISNPLPRRYLMAGIGLGLVAVFGRNHGVYGLIGSLGTLGWLRHTDRPKFLREIFLWGAGIVIGFLPILIMMLTIPGFAKAFWESIQFLFEHKATNLPLPVPWPWRVDFATSPFSHAVRGVLIGLYFIGTLTFSSLAMLWIIRQRVAGKPVAAVVVAAACLAPPYTHYAFSRADYGHLAQGIFPLLIGCLALLSTAASAIKWPLTTLLCASSVWMLHVFHPGWQCFASKRWVEVEISGSTLQVDPSTAEEIALLRRLANQQAPDGQTFLALPFWPGAYALLERKAPLWEIYALFPRSKLFEKKEIERIRASAPKFAVVLNWPLDGREELRFQNTHPLTYRYILDNFELSPCYCHLNYQIYLAKAPRQKMAPQPAESLP